MNEEEKKLAPEEEKKKIAVAKTPILAGPCPQCGVLLHVRDYQFYCSYCYYEEEIV